MLRVRTYLKEVPGKGIGCFAAEDIPFGSIVWKKTIFDMVVNESSVQATPDIFQEFVEKYGCRHADQVIVCIDNARFINHSFDPNVRPKDMHVSVASRYIRKDEELLVDYTEQCDDDKMHGVNFEVICNDTNNKQEDIDADRVNVDIIMKGGKACG